MYHHLIGQLGTTVGSHEGEVSYDWPQQGGHFHDDLSVPRHNHSTGMWCKWDCGMTESNKIFESTIVKVNLKCLNNHVTLKSWLWDLEVTLMFWESSGGYVCTPRDSDIYCAIEQHMYVCHTF